MVIVAIIAIVVIVGIIISAFLWLGYISPPSNVATLIIEKGNVEINSGNSWITAKNNSQLKEKDSIRTLENSRVNIVFFESSVIRLDENTEISLEKLDETKRSIQLLQNSGTTWNKVLKLSGVSSYEIQTPSAIATVRGTSFAINVKGNETNISLVNGSLQVNSYELIENKDRKMEKKYIATETMVEKESAWIGKGSREIKKMPLKGNNWIEENQIKDRRFIVEKADNLIEKYRNIINIAKSRNNLSDEQIRQYVIGYVEGRYTIKKAIEEGIISESDMGLMPEELKRSEGIGTE